MTKIYTKTGDTGQTSLLGGARTDKDCISLMVIGEIDELNAELGMARALLGASEPAEFLRKISRDLFKVGSELAATQNENVSASLDKIDSAQILELEKEIDKIWGELPELKNFILPGGCVASASLHKARAICRRAERALVTLGRETKLRPEIYQYLNRLSDYLFATARFVNFKNSIEEEIV
ncbi:MAG: ATP:cob(I)alamin adenosyltransferase [Candidatus Magasanikbacteria bacterium RIFOXYC2_FULL_42_28]|uniref:Corrinoid adenosyltransferase n=1 Tax=Candidatus Magasanikbacteria bacterium RIFOXYC2_FULL_42_28 TaxID=1798704 RepID=A0A1F6NWU2_9BACT|nr:MAG: ATP:cob(I)alamin adenosyltransferase [Candidatus Magasanikbacteria bacterium RIFOXYC2_FULL_42_28]